MIAAWMLYCTLCASPCRSLPSLPSECSPAADRCATSGPAPCCCRCSCRRSRSRSRLAPRSSSPPRDRRRRDPQFARPGLFGGRVDGGRGSRHESRVALELALDVGSRRHAARYRMVHAVVGARRALPLRHDRARIGCVAGGAATRCRESTCSCLRRPDPRSSARCRRRSSSPSGRSPWRRRRSSSCCATSRNIGARATDSCSPLAHFALIAMPWNVALWWQLMRLRVAVELDCDARVLRDADARSYGDLLLEVARPRRRLALMGATAFAERASQLERRIRAIGRRRGQRVATSATGRGGGWSRRGDRGMGRAAAARSAAGVASDFAGAGCKAGTARFIRRSDGGTRRGRSLAGADQDRGRGQRGNEAIATVACRGRFHTQFRARRIGKEGH